jgi:hypothetical protein
LSLPYLGSLAYKLPIAAIAAFLKAGNNLAQVRIAPMAANNVAMHHNYKVEMVGHDDIVFNIYHRVMGVDAM